MSKGGRSQVPKMYGQPEELRRTLSSVSQYHVLPIGPRAPVRLPQQMKPALLPGKDGEDLVPFLYNLRESGGGRGFFSFRGFGPGFHFAFAAAVFVILVILVIPEFSFVSFGQDGKEKRDNFTRIFLSQRKPS